MGLIGHRPWRRQDSDDLKRARTFVRVSVAVCMINRFDTHQTQKGRKCAILSSI